MGGTGWMGRTGRAASTAVALMLSFQPALPALPAHPAVPAQDPPSFRSTSSELVVLPVVATNNQNRYVSDLAREQFVVFDNGRKVSVEFFTNEDAPATIGLVVDASGSMKKKLGEVLAATLAFAKTSNPEDELFALRFNDDVRSAVAGRAGAGVPADRPRDQKRLHAWLLAAGSGWCVSPDPRRSRARRRTTPQGTDAARLLCRHPFFTAVTRVLLKWLERSLLAFGLALGLWCAVILVRAHQTQTMPPPKVTVTQTVLPGTTTSPPAPAPAPLPGSWVARLEVPSVRLATTVLEGTDDGTLSRGSGHIEDTPFPGELGNVGIAGHRDTVFRPLRHIRLGDALDLTTADRVYHYRISKTL